MRVHLLLSFSAALVRAAPGGGDRPGGGGGGHHDDVSPGHGPKDSHSYHDSPSHDQYESPLPVYSSSAYSKPTYSKTTSSEPTYSKPSYSKPTSSEPTYSKPSYSEPTYSKPTYSEPTYSKPSYSKPTYSKPAYSSVKPPKSSEYPTPVPTKSKDYPKPSPFTCPRVCRLDFHGTLLAYPTVIEYSEVYAETVNAYITEFNDGSPAQTSEVTITAPIASPEPPLTWTAFDVVLTYPTTYVAYTSINYATVVPLTAESTCSTTGAPLNYPTVWPSLVAPSSEIQQPGSIPPARIISWLDTLPTVQAQLGGHVCDPQNGGLAPFVPTATVLSATTIAGNTRIVHSTIVSVTPPPPPPPPAPVTPTFTTSSPSLVLQTTNAAMMVRKPGAEGWIGNALAAVLLAL